MKLVNVFAPNEDNPASFRNVRDKLCCVILQSLVATSIKFVMFLKTKKGVLPQHT